MDLYEPHSCQVSGCLRFDLSSAPALFLPSYLQVSSYQQPYHVTTTDPTSILVLGVSL